MATEKLIQWCTVDIHPTVCGLNCSECEHEHSAHVCPHCSAQLRYDCDIDIETGTLEPLLRCYSCGYTM